MPFENQTAFLFCSLIVENKAVRKCFFSITNTDCSLLISSSITFLLYYKCRRTVRFMHSALFFILKLSKKNLVFKKNIIIKKALYTI